MPMLPSQSGFASSVRSTTSSVNFTLVGPANTPDIYPVGARLGDLSAQLFGAVGRYCPAFVSRRHRGIRGLFGTMLAVRSADPSFERTQASDASALANFKRPMPSQIEAVNSSVKPAGGAASWVTWRWS